MKIIPLALFSLAAFGFAGCTPTDPPSDFGKDTDRPTGGLTVIRDTPSNSGDVIGSRNDTANAFKLFNQETGEWDPRAVVTVVYFGFDKYSVGAEEQSKLVAVAKNQRLIVAGYADYFGTDQYNQGLSDKRAQSVRDYLVTSGHGDASIEKQAFGKYYAKARGTRAEVARDRRVVVVNADYKPNP